MHPVKSAPTLEPLLQQIARLRRLDRGTLSVLALWCIHGSRRLDEFWQHRFTANAALKMATP